MQFRNNWKSVEKSGIPDDEKTYLVTYFDGDSWAEPWLETSYICPEYGHVMWENINDEDVTHYAALPEFPQN